MTTPEHSDSDDFHEIIENSFSGAEATADSLTDVVELAEMLLSGCPEKTQRLAIACIPKNRFDREPVGYIYIQTETTGDDIITAVRVIDGEDVDEGIERLSLIFDNDTLLHQEANPSHDLSVELRNALLELATYASDPLSKSLANTIIAEFDVIGARLGDTTNTDSELLQATRQYLTTHMGTETRIKSFIPPTEKTRTNQINGHIIQSTYTYPVIDPAAPPYTVKTLDIVVVDEVSGNAYELSHEPDESFELKKTTNQNSVSALCNNIEFVDDDSHTNPEIDEEIHDALKSAGLLNPQQVDIDFINEVLAGWLSSIIDSGINGLAPKQDDL